MLESIPLRFGLISLTFKPGTDRLQIQPRFLGTFQFFVKIGFRIYIEQFFQNSFLLRAEMISSFSQSNILRSRFTDFIQIICRNWIYIFYIGEFLFINLRVERIQNQ